MPGEVLHILERHPSIIHRRPPPFSHLFLAPFGRSVIVRIKPVTVGRLLRGWVGERDPCSQNFTDPTLFRSPRDIASGEWLSAVERDGDKREEFGDPVQEQVAGGPAEIGHQLPPDRFRVVLGHDHPDDGRRSGGPLLDELPKQVSRNRVLDEEPSQSVKIDTSHVGSHGAV